MSLLSLIKKISFVLAINLIISPVFFVQAKIASAKEEELPLNTNGDVVPTRKSIFSANNQSANIFSSFINALSSKVYCGISGIFVNSCELQGTQIVNQNNSTTNQNNTTQVIFNRNENRTDVTEQNNTSSNGTNGVSSNFVTDRINELATILRSEINNNSNVTNGVGPQGPQGPQGIQGQKGSSGGGGRGPRGADGEDALLAVGPSGYVLQSDGASTQWVATTTLGFGAGAPGSGTVTSIDMTVPTGLSITGGPITTSGIFAVSLTSGYVIPLTASTTNWSTAFGWGNHATQGYLTSLNLNALAPVVVGNGNATTSSAYANASIFGRDNNATANSAIAIGKGNNSSGGFSITFGSGNLASDASSTAIGSYNIASGFSSMAYGYQNQATGAYSKAIGSSNITSNNSSTAFGMSNNVSGTTGLAFGYANNVSGTNALSFGRLNNVSINGSSAFGSNITNDIATSTMVGPSNSAKVTILSTGELQANFITASSTTATSTFNGAVDIKSRLLANGSAGTTGYILQTNGSGVQWVATSSLGISGGTETDPVFITSQAFNVDAGDITNLSNLSGTNTGDQDLTGLLVKSNNLSDLTNATTSRTNLGLGSLATLNTINNSNWSGTALSIANGGTGTTTAPAFGQLLLGNNSGGYDLVSTSSLGISGGTFDVNALSPVQVGNGNNASGTNASAFGRGNTASGSYSLAMGYGVNAVGVSSIVVGRNNTAIGGYAAIFGTSNSASGDHSSTFGHNNTASATGSSSFGNNITNAIANSTMIGPSNSAKVTILSSGELQANFITATQSSATSTFDGGVNLLGRLIANGDVGTSGYVLQNTGTGVQWVATSSLGISGGGSLDVNALNPIRIGFNNIASGTRAVSMGYQNDASGIESTASGYYNIASGDKSAAIGWRNTVSAYYGSAIGVGNVAEEFSSAIGYGNTVESNSSAAVGYGNQATVDSSFAFGYYNNADGGFSSAFGNDNTASGYESVAFGSKNTASALGASAFGNDVINAIANSTMIGPSNSAKVTILSTGEFKAQFINATSTTATSSFNGAINIKSRLLANGSAGTSGYVLQNTGTGVQWVATSSLGITGGGGSTDVNALDPIEVGFGNTAAGYQASAIGYTNFATGNQSFASGWGNDSLGIFSMASGYDNTASGDRSTASGYYNSATRLNASAFGSQNTASATSSSAIGRQNTSSGVSSSAFGMWNTSSGLESIAFGYNNQASNTNAIAIGSNNQATAANSAVFGSAITNNIANSLMIGPSQSAAATILSTGEFKAPFFTASSTTATSTFNGAIDLKSRLLANGSVGTSGYVLQNTGTGVQWVATSSLGITGGGGGSTDVNALDPIEVGFGNTASSTYGTGNSSVGFENTVSTYNDGASAFGYRNDVTGDYSSAFGYRSIASGFKTTAAGHYAIAAGDYSVSAGYSTYADGERSVAIGSSNSANENYSIAIGTDNRANGVGSVALGRANYTNNGIDGPFFATDDSVVMGAYNYADKEDVVAVGFGNNVYAIGASAFGRNLNNNIANSVMIGSSQAGAVTILSTGELRAQSITATSTTATSTFNGPVNIASKLLANGSAGTAGYILQNTGTGVQWVSTSSVGFVGGGGGGSSQWSDDGSNIFFDTGNVGIGTATPGYGLDIDTDMNITGALYASGDAGTLGQLLQSTATGLQWVSTSSLGIDAGALSLNNLNPIEVGNGNNAGGTEDSAIGRGNSTSGFGAQAFGRTNTAYGQFSLAYGNSNNVNVPNDTGMAFGVGNTVTGNQSYIGGYLSTVSGTRSFAYGYNLNNSNDQSIMIGYDQSYIQISSTTPGSTVKFNGYTAGSLSTNGSGVVTASSDERLKDISGDYGDGLEALRQIDPIVYKWNDVSGLADGLTYVGFSAQNIQSVIPEAVNKANGGFLSLQDRPIMALTINAVKELDEKISWMEEYVSQTTDGIIAYFKELTVDKLNINGEVCVDDVCVSKEEFKDLLQGNGGGSSGTHVPTPTPGPVDDTPPTTLPDEDESGDNQSPVDTPPVGPDLPDEEVSTPETPAEEPEQEVQPEPEPQPEPEAPAPTE